MLHQFSLTPRVPAQNGFSGLQNPYLYGALLSFGGNTTATGRFTLGSQYNNDELIIGYDPVDPSDESDLSDIHDDLRRHDAFWLYVLGIRVKTDEQLQFVFEFTKPSVHTSVAQFFVGSAWARSERIDDPTETVALLIDAPPSDQYGQTRLDIFARLASYAPEARIGIKQIDGYII
jgi:hypothetical protein